MHPATLDPAETRLIKAFFVYLTMTRSYSSSTAIQYQSMIRAALKRAHAGGKTLVGHFEALDAIEKARVGYAFKLWAAFIENLQNPKAGSDVASRLTAEVEAFLETYEIGVAQDPNGGTSIAFITPRVSWALWQLGLSFIQPWLSTPWGPNKRNAFGPAPREVWRNKGYEATIPSIISGLDWRAVHFEPGGSVRIDDLSTKNEYRFVEAPQQAMFSILWQAGGWAEVDPKSPRPIAPKEPRSPFTLTALQISLGMGQWQFRRDDPVPNE